MRNLFLSKASMLTYIPYYIFGKARIIIRAPCLIAGFLGPGLLIGQSSNMSAIKQDLLKLLSPNNVESTYLA